jgi:DNA adenine methylase
MQYFGGKARIAKDLARIINLHLESPRWRYVEPFCGGLNVTQYIRPDRPRVACDFNSDLIDLYNEVQNGWTPPDFISEELYNSLKKQNYFTPEKAFAGFACSYSGKYFGGYARNNRGRNYAKDGKNSLLRKFKTLEGVEFRWINFLGSVWRDFVIYCDPPYAGTTGYKTGAFDHAAFWQKCRELSEDNIIFISEYDAPEDFIEVWRKDVKLEIRDGDGKRKDRIEKLYTYV